MKKITCLLSLFLPLSLCAAERSVANAAALAAEFMNEQAAMAPSRQGVVASSSYLLTHTREKIGSDAPAFYVFNRGEKEGFVVVSADDRTEDVLMYSDKGAIDVENANPNLRFWLNHLQEEISMANDSNAIDRSPARKATMATAIAPLLVNDKGEEIAWYQESPYWNNCPKDLWKTAETCLTGCVATAASQIMYKWRYPEQGTGAHSYKWECCTNSSCTKTSSKIISKDFSTVTFDWANMLPTYAGKSATDAQKAAVAELMYSCGVACDMQYGGNTIGGSGAWTDDMGYGMITYFGYTLEKFITTYSSRSSYSSAKGGKPTDIPSEYGVSSAKFVEYFNADLEAGRPILMGGEDDGGGHEFVCDGRDANGKFHINWGWEGESNCYCQLTSLKPKGSSYNFSTNIDAIYGLQPGQIDTVYVTGIEVLPLADTLKINETVELTAIISPDDATDKHVIWTCDNLKVASVNNGLVRAVGTGTAHIIATSREGQKTAQATITVTDEVAPSGIFFHVNDASQLIEGDEVILVTTYNNNHYAASRETKMSGMSKSKKVYLDNVGIAIKDKSVTLDDNSEVAVFTLSPSDEDWVLKEQTEGQLSASAVTKLSWGDSDSIWSITSSGDNMTIANTNTGYGRILFNGSVLAFSNYGSSTTTDSKVLLPQLYARNPNVPGTVVPVNGVAMGQASAILQVGERLELYYTISPAYATNTNVIWSSGNSNVATVDQKGNVTAVSAGKSIITVTTVDGDYAATCVVSVSNSVISMDTIYVMASEAVTIAKSQKAGESSEAFYGVKGYVTSPNSDSYGGFYIADNPGTEKTFQGFNCTMPSGYIVLTEGQYVCIFGYIMNYNNEKMQIKDGEVVLLDTPQGVEQVLDAQGTMHHEKFLMDGQFYILRGDKIYNAQGLLVR